MIMLIRKPAAGLARKPLRTLLATSSAMAFAALLFSPAPAFACGPAAADGVTVICTGDTLNLNGSNGFGTGTETDVVVTVRANASVTGDDVGIALGAGARVTTEAGSRVEGAEAGISVSGDDAILEIGGSVLSSGVGIATDGAEITVAQGGSVTVDNPAVDPEEDAVFAAINALGHAKVTVAGTITASGDLVQGLFLESGGDVTVTSTGRIVTDGDYASAVGLANFLTPGLTNKVLVNGNISTSGAHAYGIDAREAIDEGIIGANTAVTLAGTLTTTGNGAHGIFTSVSEGSDSPVLVSGTLRTSGTAAHGVFAGLANGGDSSITVASGGEIEVTGQDSLGIALSASGEFPGLGTANVIVEAGARVFSENGVVIGEVDDPEVPVNPAVSRVNTHVTIAGEVARSQTSDKAIDLGAGDDRITLLPTYAITGFVDGGAGFDTFVLDGAEGTNGTIEIVVGNTARASNFEDIRKTGAGTWTIVGDAFGGPSLPTGTIEAGTLVVNGSVPGLDLVVRPGATLRGMGAVRDVSVQGGTLATGDAISNFFTGDLALDAASTLVMRVNDQGLSDRLVVNGTISLGGATLDVRETGGGFAGANPFVYTIIENDGDSAVNGQFGRIVNTLAFLTPTVDYAAAGGNFVQLTLTPNNVGPGPGPNPEPEPEPEPEPGPLFPTVAATLNQTAAALALDRLDQDGDADAALAYNQILFMTAPEARQTFDLVSGEAYAALQYALTDVADLFSRNLQRRGALAGTGAAGGVPLWLGVLGQSNKRDGDGNAAALDTRSYGVAGGVDLVNAAIGGDGSVRLGLAAGYLRSDADVRGRLSNADVDSTLLGAWLNLASGRFQLGAAFSMGWHGIETDRRIVSGPIDRRASSERDARTIGFSGQIRYDFGASAFRLSPLATLDVANVKIDAAQESGAGALDLSLGRENYTAARVGGGLEAGYASAGFEASVRVLHEWEIGEQRAEQRAMLAGSPRGFTALGALRRDAIVAVGAGIGFNISPSMRVSASYDASLNKDERRHRGGVGLSMRF